MKSSVINRSNKRRLRFITLGLVISFFIFVPFSNWYANQKIAFNQARLVALADGPVMGGIYAVLDSFYSLWENPVRAATSNNGSLWAYTVLGIPLSDPLGLLAETINSVKFPIKYLIGGIIPITLALLLGRFFCSWLCPMHLVFEWTNKIRDLLDKWKVPFMRVKLAASTRVYVFWLGMISSYFTGAWVWHFVLPYISFTHEIFSFVIFSSFTVGIYYLIAVIVLDLALIPGEFCRSVCPTGYLLSVIGRLRVFGIKKGPSSCPKACVQCQNVCPIDLYPKKAANMNSCHLCLNCVDACPKEHLSVELMPFYQKIIASSRSSKEDQNFTPEKGRA